MPDARHDMNEQVVTLKAVGDICPGDASILGLGICSLTIRRGVDFPFRYIAGEFSRADIVIGNLEGTLSGRMRRRSSLRLPMCGLPEFAEELRKTGFNVISLANNHVLDNGVETFLETVELLRAQGIEVCGLRGANEFYSEPAIVTVRGKKIGVLSYNWIATDKFPFADRYIAQSTDGVVNYTWNRNPAGDEENQGAYLERNLNVINDIRLLKQKVDIVVLSPHWAFEFVHHPPYGVTLEARSFIDAGADLIAGSHPHVIQGYETYRGGDIFYSLGNFIFDSRRRITRDSAILEAAIRKDGGIDCSLRFIRLNERFQPTYPPPDVEGTIAGIVEESNLKISSSENRDILSDDRCYREFEKQYRLGKFHAVAGHLRAVFVYPPVIKGIMKKAFGFLRIVRLRLQGKRVRW